MVEPNSVLVGVAGEYFVAGELSKRGYIASITLRNTKGVDIVCSNSNATKTVSIQVKTNKGLQKRWILNKKAENYHADNLYYIFVNLNNNSKAPDFFIVPSKIVANSISKHYENWKNTPNRQGGKHKETPMRLFKDVNGKYLNKWDLLNL